MLAPRALGDFLTDEQRMIRDTARDFARAELSPHAAKWEAEGWIPDAVVAKLGELGFLGMVVPEQWGGSFTDYVAYALAMEEIAAGCAATATLMSVHNSVGCGPILAWGSDAQKQEFLPDMAAGRKVGCFCLTEPQAGSEANNLKTRAVQLGSPLAGAGLLGSPLAGAGLLGSPLAGTGLNDGGWVLNGNKQFVTNGKRAAVAIVFAVTDPELGKKGLSAFVVPTGTPGFKPQKLEDKLGIRASDTCAILLEDCRLPAESLLGPRGKGLAIALSNLEGGRIGIAAQALGIARAAFEAALAYAKERTQFGKKLAEHASIANYLADMHTRINAARMLILHAARLRSEGVPCLSEASQAKLYASELAEWVCSKAIQVHGGYGYLHDYPVERHYRDARITQIYEGTSEIQRMLIARNLCE